MNITNIKVREVTPINALNLAATDRDYVTEALIHVNKEFANLKPQEEKVYETSYYAHEVAENPSKDSLAVKQEIRFIKYTDELKVNFFKSEKVEDGSTNIMVQVFTLDKGISKNIYNFIDGEFDGEASIETDEITLDLPEEFTELTEEEKGEADVTALDLPCIQNGCCSFRYNGNPFNPLVRYKWCGANCGSGTPVNALDRCCRTHDNCYGSYGSYPGRCACDRNLIRKVNIKFFPIYFLLRELR